MILRALDPYRKCARCLHLQESKTGTQGQQPLTGRDRSQWRTILAASLSCSRAARGCKPPAHGTARQPCDASRKARVTSTILSASTLATYAYDISVFIIQHAGC